MSKGFLPWLLVLVLVLGVVLPSQAQSSHDLQTWLGLNTIAWQEGKWYAAFWAEGRVLDDLSLNQGYFIGPWARYKAHPNLDLELGLIYILLQATPEDYNLLRYQFAITPHFSLGENAHFFFRTRAELIRGDLELDRIRHNAMIYFNIKDRGPLVGFYFGEELFYTWKTWEVTESRFTPFSFVWKPSPRWLVHTYYTWQYLFPSTKNNHALGLIVELKVRP